MVSSDPQGQFVSICSETGNANYSLLAEDEGAMGDSASHSLIEKKAPTLLLKLRPTAAQ